MLRAHHPRHARHTAWTSERTGRRRVPGLPAVISCKATDVRWLVPSSDAVRTDCDAIIVLAGGQRTDGRLPHWVERRLLVSLDLQRLQERQTPILCCGGGTPHKPPILRPDGYVLHEGTECAQFLIAQERSCLRNIILSRSVQAAAAALLKAWPVKGAEPALLLKEASSYDTIGNGYFAMTIHAVPAGWRRLAVVTSDFHMPRSRRIFEVAAALAGEALWQDPCRFRLSFHSASDVGVFPPEVLAARMRREGESLQDWERTAQGFCGLAELHAWLHDQHLCYAVRRQAR